MEYQNKKLENFIEDNRSKCEQLADFYFCGDIYQAAEYLLDQI